MPNPYRYTREELDDLVDEWHEDDTIKTSLEEFIIYTTKFTEAEYETWIRYRRVPLT